MPYITVKLMEGRSFGRKAKLAEKMAEAVSEVLEIDPIHVRIEFIELKEGNFAIAGRMTPRFEDSGTEERSGQSGV